MALWQDTDLNHPRATPGVFVFSGLVSTVIILLGVLLAHNFRRWYLDSKMGMKAGIAPSCFIPLGAELLALQMLKSHTIFGELVLSMMQAVCKISEKSRILRAWIFHMRVVAFFKPETIEVILNSNTVLEKAMFYKLLHPWLGTGLLTSTGNKWRNRRKMLTPTFHFKILEDFLPIFNEQAAIFTRLLKPHSHLKPVDIVPYVTMCTLDIIGETAMGVHLNAQEQTDSEYVQAIYQLGEGFLYRTSRPWLWPTIIFNLTPEGRKWNGCVDTVHSFTKKVIEERKSEILARLQRGAGSSQDNECGQVIGIKRRQAFLNMILERHISTGEMSIEDIREEVDTFMFEGHDTTAMGISWCLYLLGLYPEAQKKVHEELDEVFADDPDRHVSTEDLSKLKYLECCMKESQRLFPSVPYIARVLREDVKVSGYTIPKNTTAFLFIYELHRDKTSFPDPENFIPERFFPENSVGRHPYAYVPFSAGPRNCIGQRFAILEEKVVLTHILRKYDLVAKQPLDKLHICGELITRSAEGLHLWIKERNGS